MTIWNTVSSRTTAQTVPYFISMAQFSQQQPIRDSVSVVIDNVNDTVSENVNLSVISYNMRGFNQGSQAVRDLIFSIKPDILMLQEHWLTPANLSRFEDEFPQYLCFGSSAMSSCVENGVLRGGLMAA